MGSGKKNKRGGAPKQKGKLHAALVKDQLAVEQRLKQRQVEQHRLQKQKLAQSTPDQLQAQRQLRKQAKVQRQRQRDFERREDELIQQEAEERLQLEEAHEQAQRAGTAAPPVVVLDEVTDKTPKVVKRRRGPTPYKPGEHILLVGEGNFSFAHSLLLQDPPIVTPQLMIATAFDSFETAQQKYPDLLHHVNAIREAGAQVLFDVDATKLDKVKALTAYKGQWDRVVFNFPHVGQGITDQDRNVRANQTLVLNFFRSVAPLLRVGESTVPASGASATSKSSKKGGKKGSSSSNGNKKGKKRASDSDDDGNDDDDDDDDDGDLTMADMDTDANSAIASIPPPPTTSGTVLITLRTVSPYSLWSLPHLGSRGPLLAPSILPKPLPKQPQPTFGVVRSFEFDPAEWQGYEHRRTIGYVPGVSSLPNDDLNLSAKERGEKKRLDKEAQELRDKEDKLGGELTRRGGKALMRTYEFQLVNGGRPEAVSASVSATGANGVGLKARGGKAGRIAYGEGDFDYE